MALDKKEIRKRYKNSAEFFKGEKNKHKCECGCGEFIQLTKTHYQNGIPRFLFGHAARLKIGGPKYDKKKYYSVEDIAEISKVTDQTVRQWSRNGYIKPATTIGKKYLYLRTEVDAFLKNRQVPVKRDASLYISFRELMDQGISRLKLQAYAREGKIAKPVRIRRRSMFLKADIDKYRNNLLKDEAKSPHRVRSTPADSNLKSQVDSLKNQVIELEKRVVELERLVLILIN